MAATHTTKALDAQTTNGRGPVVPLCGDYNLVAFGAFAGATVTLSYVTDDSVDPPTLGPAVEGVSFTAQDDVIVTLAGKYQAIVSGAGGGASITLHANKIYY